MQNDTTYELIDFYEYQSKNKKVYYIVIVYMKGKDTHEVLKICCTKTDPLYDFLVDNIPADEERHYINDNVGFKFNNYKKCYEPYLEV